MAHQQTDIVYYNDISKLIYTIIMLTALVYTISLPLGRWYVYYVILSEAKIAVAARE